MNIAFLISAHTDPTHLARLVRALPEGAPCYVHIDKKVEIRPFEEACRGLEVHFISRRTSIMWGSIGQVRYQMELIRAALRHSPCPDYLVALSGLDYPLWSNERIRSYFTELGGRQCMQVRCLTDHPDEAELYREYRLLNEYPWRYRSPGSKLRVALRHLVKALGFRRPLTIGTAEGQWKLYKGGSWWGITANLAREALHQWDDNKVLERYFSTCFAPDELFIHTVAMNHPRFAPQCDIIEQGPVRLEDLSPLTYIDYRGAIKVFTEDDLGTLMDSGKMFCRKTVTGVSDALLDRIDRLRLNP